MSSLIGRCGVYYGICVIYRIFKDEDLERAKRLSERFNCPPEGVRCKVARAQALEIGASEISQMGARSAKYRNA